MFGSPLISMLLVAIAGWINREQLAVIDYLKEENRVLRELLGSGGCGSATTRLAPPGGEGQGVVFQYSLSTCMQDGPT
jgi:hypothetical protein